MVAQGLLGDVELPGCAGKIELLGSHQEIFQVQEINHDSFPPGAFPSSIVTGRYR